MNEERGTGAGSGPGAGPAAEVAADAETDEDLAADDHVPEAEADRSEESSGTRPTSRKRPTKDKAGFVVTERDRQVIAYAAIARYLSTEQLERLFFPGRERKDTRQRLLRLAGEWRRASDNPRSKNGNCEPPYLRRRRFRRFDGEWVELWTPTDAGYLLAEHVLRAALRVPRVDVSAEFLEHSAQLSELLVGLVDPALDPCPRCGQGPRAWAKSPRRDVYALACRACGATADAAPPHAAQLPFRWTTSENARLPWHEYDKKGGGAQERFIVPDGILELPERGLRLFLECEMGSNTIVGGATKPNATVAKAERYERYLTGRGKDGRGFYAAAHPDGLEPEVLYLVLTEGRRDAVNVALAAWRKQRSATSPQRALTFREAVAELRGTTSGKPAAPPPKAVAAILTETDVEHLKTFFTAVMAPLKDARAKARAAGATPPPYPPAADEVSALLRRLSRSRPGSPNGPAPGPAPALDPGPLAPRGSHV